jgi:RHS repeat-associated protein
MIFDKTGSLAGTKRHDYLPFGEELGAGVGGRTPQQGYSAIDGVRQQFTGYEADAETGLNFAQARYQSPLQGRFTSVDPTLKSIDSENPQTLNRYTYALNNPLAYVDPDGEDSLKIGTYDDLSTEQKRLFETYVQKNYGDQLGKTTVTDFAKALFNKSADLANGITTGDGKGLLSQSQLTSFIGTTHMLEKRGVIDQVASISEIHGDEAKDHTYRIIGDLINNSSAVEAIKKAFPNPIAGSGHGKYSDSNREQGFLGAPNGQVSRVPDGTGVDVDYRCILCPGHKSPGGVGSDIRVGTHYEDHVKRYGPIPALSRIKDSKGKK